MVLTSCIRTLNHFGLPRDAKRTCVEVQDGEWLLPRLYKIGGVRTGDENKRSIQGSRMRSTVQFGWEVVG